MSEKRWVGRGDRPYEELTRERYRDQQVARRYAEEYEGRLRLRNLIARFIATREKRVVRALFPSQARTLLDIPCGTGKLHSVVRGRPLSVIAADVSAEMLDVARTYYSGIDVRFVQLDGTRLPFQDQSFDCVVCLRLFHRIPMEIKHAVLRECARVSAGSVIVSLGVVGTLQRFRLALRRGLTGVDTIPFPVSPSELEDILPVPGFVTLSRRPVAWGLSAEWVVRLDRA